MKESLKDRLLSILPERSSPSGPEVVSIHGTKHIRFQTDEGLTVNLPIASISLRLVAFGIDMTLLAVTLGVWSQLISRWYSKFEFSSQSAIVFGILSLLIVSLNPLLVELLFRGRSVGSMVAGLDVVHESGGEVTRSSIAIRRLTSYLEPLLPMWFVFALPAFERSFIGLVLMMGFVAWAQSLHVFASPARQRFSERFSQLVVVERPTSIFWYDSIPRTIHPELKLSAEQLDFYGSYELHVMEQCLHAYSQRDRRLVKKAANAIRSKLNLGSAIDDYELVVSCYNQLKDDLEAKQRLGILRLRKRPGTWASAKS